MVNRKKFIESNDPTYLKIKGTGFLTQPQLDFLSYLYRFGPCTFNELRDAVASERDDLTPQELQGMNKLPAPLKRLKVIKENQSRKCKSSGQLSIELVVTNHIPTRKFKNVSGKTKKILEHSINSALLAVEVYNKPRATFRSEAFISLMIIAWTKLLHAYYRHNEGEIYYEKEPGKDSWKKNEFGEKIAWGLQKCINKCNDLSTGLKANLEFFIPLRNKIEHTFIDHREVDNKIFGQCQALLYNYENFLVDNFGEEFALNENLVFSLQFSRLRVEEQINATREAMKPDVKSLFDYIDKYNNELPEHDFNSQEYSIRVLLVPYAANTKKHDLAVQFLKLEDDKEVDLDTVTTIIKKNVVTKEILNPGTYITTDIIREANKVLDESINSHYHTCLTYIFRVKPFKEDLDKGIPKFQTNTKYCGYFEKVDRYLYTEDWLQFVISFFSENKMSKEELRQLYKNKKRKNIKSYE